MPLWGGLGRVLAILPTSPLALICNCTLPLCPIETTLFWRILCFSYTFPVSQGNSSLSQQAIDSQAYSTIFRQNHCSTATLSVPGNSLLHPPPPLPPHRPDFGSGPTRPQRGQTAGGSMPVPAGVQFATFHRPAPPHRARRDWPIVWSIFRCLRGRLTTPPRGN